MINPSRQRSPTLAAKTTLRLYKYSLYSYYTCRSLYLASALSMQLNKSISTVSQFCKSLHCKYSSIQQAYFQVHQEVFGVTIPCLNDDSNPMNSAGSLRHFRSLISCYFHCVNYGSVLNSWRHIQRFTSRKVNCLVLKLSWICYDTIRWRV